MVVLTDHGIARLWEAVPVHLRRVSELFIERLDDQEVAILEHALEKVTPGLLVRLSLASAGDLGALAEPRGDGKRSEQPDGDEHEGDIG